jgi:hypothetical protein
MKDERGRTFCTLADKVNSKNRSIAPSGRRNQFTNLGIVGLTILKVS